MIELRMVFRPPSSTTSGHFSEESLKKIYELDHYLRDRTLKDPDNQRMLNELGRHSDQGNLTMFLEDPEVEPTNNIAERMLRPAAGDRRPQGVAMFQDGAGSQCLRGIRECALDSLAARSEFRVQVACQNHRRRAYPCMRCLWRLLVRSANQLRAKQGSVGQPGEDKEAAQARRREKSVVARADEPGIFSHFRANNRCHFGSKTSRTREWEVLRPVSLCLACLSDCVIERSSPWIVQCSDRSVRWSVS